MKLQRLVLVSVVAALPLLSGCLKSRLQLRDDDSGAGRPVQAHVTEVKGQYAVDELKAEITRLNGRIEDMERAQQQSSSQPDPKEKKITDIETRIQELEKSQADMIEVIKRLETTATSAAAAATDPNDLLERAKKALDGKEHATAIDQLSLYLKSKAKNKEDAYLYRGEAYFQSQQYKKAIVDFSKFPEKYQKSRHLPVALLRIGQSFEALGMKDDAKGFYQELTDKFPKSKEAKQIPSAGGKKTASAKAAAH